MFEGSSAYASAKNRKIGIQGPAFAVQVIVFRHRKIDNDGVRAYGRADDRKVNVPIPHHLLQNAHPALLLGKSSKEYYVQDPVSTATVLLEVLREVPVRRDERG